MKPLLILLLMGSLLACSVPPLPGATPTGSVQLPPATASQADQAVALSPASTNAADDPHASVTALSFAGDGDTFLAYIEATLQQKGVPLSHRYLTVTAADGTLWQGESALFAEESLFFLQAAQRGGATAIQVTADAGMDETALATIALPAFTEQPQNSPAPLVPFVRARLVEPGTELNRWRFDVTISYPDTGWTDYADGWHVETPDGVILGTRVLLHPHVGEQPFTRTLSDVRIPTDLTTVLIRSHDLVSGYSPDAVAIPLDVATVTAGYEVIR